MSLTLALADFDKKSREFAAFLRDCAGLLSTEKGHMPNEMSVRFCWAPKSSTLISCNLTQESAELTRQQAAISQKTESISRPANEPYLLVALTLVALTAHQTEEYLVAPLLHGEQYHFLNWAFRAGVDIAPAEVVTANLLGYAGALVLYSMSPVSRAFAFFFLFIDGMTLANGMLREEGLVRNPKRTYRIYCEEQLQVRRKRRKKLIRPRVQLGVDSGC